MRLCKGCGETLSPTQRAQCRYCSERCRYRAKAKRARDYIRTYYRSYYKRPGPKQKRDEYGSRYRPKYLREHREENKLRCKRRHHLATYGHTNFVGDPVSNTFDRYRRARAEGYRSGLEVKIARELKEAGVDAAYESITIPYQQPEKARRYTPDWVLPNGLVIESKGRWLTADRQRHLMIKAQYPQLDVRLVFSNAQARISKTSRTTYQKYCETNGFKWAHQSVPAEWLREPPNEASLAVLANLKTTRGKQ